MNKEFTYQLSGWEAHEENLEGHMATLRKYGKPYELKEKTQAGRTMYSVWIEDPQHRVPTPEEEEDNGNS